MYVNTALPHNGQLRKKKKKKKKINIEDLTFFGTILLGVTARYRWNGLSEAKDQDNQSHRGDNSCRSGNSVNSRKKERKILLQLRRR
jgi:hypothetical protein